jgi:hypothetical protein
MPRGPKGEKRPADVIGAAIIVAKIATGEIRQLHTWDFEIGLPSLFAFVPKCIDPSHSF